jgi:hypothetical protein
MDGTIDVTVDQAHKFFEDSFLEAKGSSLQTSFRRPGIVRSSLLTSSKDDFAIVVSGHGWLLNAANIQASLF